MTTSPRLEYVANFDGLRGFAVILVLLAHGSYGIFSGGFLGVDLFFIISGYLITSLLWGEYTTTTQLSLGNFYARRILRLYPALIIAVIVALALWKYIPNTITGDPLIASFASFFYLANIVDDQLMGSLSPLWSLSVEEHFYLFWPIFMLTVLTKLAATQRHQFIMLLLAGVTIFRIVAGYHQGEWRYGIFYIDPYGFTLCRIDCILIGAWMFFWTLQHTNSKTSPKKLLDKSILGASILLILLLGLTLKWSDPNWLMGGFIVTNIICAIVIFLALRNPDIFLLNNKAIVWVGQRSYGIYAYHYPIFLALEQFRIPQDNVNFIFVSIVRIVLTIIVAALSYRLVEQPILRYKKKFRVNLHPTGAI